MPGSIAGNINKRQQDKSAPPYQDADQERETTALASWGERFEGRAGVQNNEGNSDKGG